MSLEAMLRENLNLLTFDMRSHMKGLSHFGETSEECFIRMASRYGVQATRLPADFEAHLDGCASISGAPHERAEAWRSGMAAWVRTARRAGLGSKRAVMLSLRFRFHVDVQELKHEWHFLESVRMNRKLQEISRLYVREPNDNRAYKWDFLAVRIHDALVLQVP
ncbi:hypothetical protein DB346_16995 [Verrucomicrobia bacterium LW23]|nr:hypothetical protein DB346_16995 [Verrucomicrobia bacterium LW23]